MGWWGEGYHKGEGLKNVLLKKYTWDSTDGKSSSKPVFYSKKGYGTHFIGMERTDKETGATEKWLAVVLTRFYKSKDFHSGMELLIKDMDESMGPCELAPKTVVAWLEKNIPTPPNEYARAWRENSKAQAPVKRRKRMKRIAYFYN